MLSNMESEYGADAAALHDAERARDDLAADLVVPPGYDLAIGAAVAVQIASSVVGLTVDHGWARTLLAVGNVAFGVVAVLQIVRFRRLNGVRVQGFVSRVILGSAMTASFGYGAALVAAYVAALRDLWWLAGLAALAGGLVYVLSGRRWLRAYRKEPGRLGRAESALWMAVLVGLAAAGLVLLVTQS
jgi:membrane protein implicated in regulation of membrane protease activity